MYFNGYKNKWNNIILKCNGKKTKNVYISLCITQIMPRLIKLVVPTSPTTFFFILYKRICLEVD